MFEAISGRMTHGPGAGKHSAMSHALCSLRQRRLRGRGGDMQQISNTIVLDAGTCVKTVKIVMCQ